MCLLYDYCLFAAILLFLLFLVCAHLFVELDDFHFTSAITIIIDNCCNMRFVDMVVFVWVEIGRVCIHSIQLSGNLLTICY